MIYAKCEWGIENTFFIYTTMITQPPEGLVKKKFNSFFIDPDSFLHNWQTKGIFTIDYLLASKKTGRCFLKYIRECAPDPNEKICIVVFRDTRIRETILIDMAKKAYRNVSVIMIEEGLGLYAKTEIEPHSLRNTVKGILYRLTGVPEMALYHLPHGYNPATERIICSMPHVLKNTELDKGDNLVQQIDVFSKENTDYFIREVLMEDVPDIKYDYVFLTQPIFPMQDQKQNDKYDRFLQQFFSVISRHGRLVIKPHPRDLWDYEKYVGANIEICPPQFSKWAFEILSGHFGNPQTITLYSSAACNGTNSKPVIFLYDFFLDIVGEDLYTPQFIRDNGIIRCGTFDELERALV